MGSDRLCVKPADPDTMFSAEDRRTMPQLRTWRWYDVRARSSPHDWDREVLLIRRAIACVVDRLRSPGIEPWMSFYGSCTNDGIIGVAHVLLRDDDGLRFHLPETAMVRSGPGYVTSYMNVEYAPESLERIWSEAGSILVGTALFLSVVGLREEDGRGLMRKCLYTGELSYPGGLTDELKEILDKARFLIATNQDFDAMLVGCREEQAETLQEALEGAVNPAPSAGQSPATGVAPVGGAGPGEPDDGQPPE